MSKFAELRVAVIGAGRMGKERARAACTLGADVVAVCDVDLTQAQQLADDIGECDAYSSFPTDAWHEIDAVFVCTPPNARGPIERAAITHGVHLFVEKPIGTNANQIQDVVELANSSDIVTAVGYMNRHRKSVRSLRQSLCGKQILGLSANWVCGNYGVRWWDDATQSGGPFNEQATHLVDLARYLLGEVKEVRAAQTSPSNASVVLVFESGAMASLFYSCESTEKAIRLQVFTSEGHMHLSGWEFDPIQSNDAVDPPTRSRDIRSQIFREEAREFFLSVCNSPAAQPLCKFQDAYLTQQLVDKIRASMN